MSERQGGTGGPAADSTEVASMERSVVASTVSARHEPWEQWTEQLLAPAQAAAQSASDALGRIGVRIADAVTSGRQIFAFGAGHASMFAMELFGRAGGVPYVQIMHLEDLEDEKRAAAVYMMDQEPERDVARGRQLAEHYGVAARDVVLIASNSGKNGAIIELALQCRQRGAYCAGFTSMAHSSATASAHPSGLHLYEVADEVVDNGCPLGDAVLHDTRTPRRFGATSSVSFCLLADLLTAAVVTELLDRDVNVDIFASVNLPQ